MSHRMRFRLLDEALFGKPDVSPRLAWDAGGSLHGGVTELSRNL